MAMILLEFGKKEESLNLLNHAYSLLDINQRSLESKVEGNLLKLKIDNQNKTFLGESLQILEILTRKKNENLFRRPFG